MPKHASLEIKLTHHRGEEEAERIAFLKELERRGWKKVKFPGDWEIVTPTEYTCGGFKKRAVDDCCAAAGKANVVGWAGSLQAGECPRVTIDSSMC